MSATESGMQRILADEAVSAALTTTAWMFGLSQVTVSRIVQVALPLAAATVIANPELRRRMYAATKAALPEPLEAFYAHMAANPVIRQSAMDDYRATYGALLDAVNREAARQAGTTDGQAREVMAAMLPAVTVVLGRVNADGTEQGFVQWVGELGMPRT